MVSPARSPAVSSTTWTIPENTVTVNTVTVYDGTLNNGTLPGQVLAVLRDLTQSPALEYARPPERLTGGFWAELFAFSLADPPDGWAGELVARVMPDPAIARKEAAVQTAVAAAGFPTPAVRASGSPSAALARAFMIMDRAPGQPLLSGLDGIAAIGRGAHLLWRIPDSLAVTMAKLHSLNPEPVRGLLDNIGTASASVGGLLEAQCQLARRHGRGDLAAAAQWLMDHPPLPAPDVICHGDLHPFNLLIDGDQMTVLDWSRALLGPRAHDVAFTSLLLAEPPLARPGPLRPLVRLLGRRLARRFIRRYQHHAGATVGLQALQWHQGLVCLRALTEVSGWASEGHEHAHAGHPWLLLGPAFAARLTATTGVRVEAR
jgi:aminoglycoside phosphotransferase (APT) family kinase protein